MDSCNEFGWLFSGTYFCYDNPGALQLTIRFVMDVDAQTYMYLYALYSWPNVILCLMGGYFIDRIGLRVCTMILATLVLIGQVSINPCLATHKYIHI